MASGQGHGCLSLRVDTVTDPWKGARIAYKSPSCPLVFLLGCFHLTSLISPQHLASSSKTTPFLYLEELPILTTKHRTLHNEGLHL